MSEDDTRTIEDYDDLIKAATAYAAAQTAGTEEMKKANEATLALIKSRKELAENMGTTIDAIEAEKDALKRRNEAGTESAKALGKLVGINKDFNDTLAGQLTNTLANSVAQGKFTEQLKQTFSPVNIMNSILSKMAQSTADLAISTDMAMVNFNKSTGALRMYQHQMVNLEKEQFRNNITIEDVAESYGSMVRNVGNLNTMSEKSQKSLALTTATLQELGVDADTTTSNINSLTMGLGMSMDQATKTQREMFVLAQAIGKPPSEMSKEFNAALPRLAAFGNKSTDVFNKMAINAKAAGMSTEAMLRITEKFDRFDTATDSVGKLNAVLGGPYLSSLEMIRKTDPTERMKMLSDATREAGKSFDTMGYYERKAVASAMGLSDVNELALVMAGKFNLVSGSVKKTSSEIEALALQTQEFNTVADVGRQVMRTFAIQFGPVLTGIKKMLGTITQLTLYFPVFKVAAAAAFVGVAIAFVSMAATISTATDVATAGITAAIKLAVAAIMAGIAAASLLYSYIGNLADIWNEANIAIKVFKMILLRAFMATPFGIIYALVQVFTYWNEIIEYGKSILKEYASEFQPLFAAFGELQERFQALSIFQGEATDWMWYFTTALEYALPYLVDAAVSIGHMVANLIDGTLVLYELLDTLGVFQQMKNLVIIVAVNLGVFVAALAAVAYIFIKVAQLAIWLLNALNPIYWIFQGITHLITQGESPSTIQALQWTIDLFKTMGSVIMAPIKAIGALISKLSEFAKMIFGGGIVGKAFGYISSFFGGGDVGITATTKTEGGGAVGTANKAKREQQKELAETIGTEVGRQVAVAMENQDKNRIQQVELVINSQTDLSHLFDFFARGVNRRLDGKPDNLAADKAAAGIPSGKSTANSTRDGTPGR